MGAGSLQSTVYVRKIQKKKNDLQILPKQKVPRAKEAITWKNSAQALLLPLLFWPEWEVLVCRAMRGLEHWSRSCLCTFISRWCRWDVSQPNEKETVLFDSLTRTKHSHKVIEKMEEDSLEQNIYLSCYSWPFLISVSFILTVTSSACWAFCSNTGVRFTSRNQSWKKAFAESALSALLLTSACAGN